MSVTIHAGTIPPRVKVLQIDDGRAFLVLYLSNVTVHFGVYNGEASAFARAFAAQFLTAADEIQAKILAAAMEATP